MSPRKPRLRDLHARAKGRDKSLEEISREVLKTLPANRDYREQSLRIHGPVCAKCGREFSGRDLRLLTVHHRDGNHLNNPPDGSNWENLCVFCHEDEHGRGLLADHLRGR